MSPRNACVGKIPHATFLVAEAAARSKKHAALTPYRCPYCRFWHVGNKDTPELQRKPAPEPPKPEGPRGTNLQRLEKEHAK